MLACVSPADADLEETLNTLKYANRARQIRNKPLVVQDPVQEQLVAFQDTIAALKTRLAHYEGGGAPLPVMLPTDVEEAPAVVPPAAPGGEMLMKRVAQLQMENQSLRAKLASLLVPGSSPEEAAAAAAAAVPVSKSPSLGGASDTGSEAGEEYIASAEEESLAAEVIEDEFDFLQKQGELSEELQELSESLALKQALLKQQCSAAVPSEGELSSLQAQLSVLEEQLMGVSKERMQLLEQVQALQEAGERGDGRKEERKASKRLEQVEAELMRLRSQQAQQTKLLQARQASERRVKELQGEIDGIKAQKVAIARRQREDAEMHRIQRAERERELKSLRRKEERTEAKLHKLEDDHAKQVRHIMEALKNSLQAKRQPSSNPLTAPQPTASRRVPTPTARVPLVVASHPSFVGQPTGGPLYAQGAVLKRKHEEVAAVQKKLRAAEGMAAGAAARNHGTSITPRGVMGPPRAAGHLTANQKNREKEVKDEKMEKTVGEMTRRPKEWLNTELQAVMDHADLLEKINYEVEQRRQAQHKLTAMEEMQNGALAAMTELQSAAGAEEAVESGCTESLAARVRDVSDRRT